MSVVLFLYYLSSVKELFSFSSLGNSKFSCNFATIFIRSFNGILALYKNQK
jgi:hypothetical protein